MAKRDHHRRGGRTTPKGTRPPDQANRHADEPPELVATVEADLRDPSPLALLSTAAALIEMTTPRPTDNWPGSDIQRSDGPSAFGSFAASGWPAMRALAMAVATLHPDELLARRLRSSVGRHPLNGPKWLGTMGEIEITDTLLQSEPLGDGDNVMIGWRWPDGQIATMVVYIDHNMGTIVKDAFVLTAGAASIAESLREIGDPDVSLLPIPPADARARITEAIEATDRTVPPIESDSWPMCRPMVEWLLRRLSSGGIGHVRPEWPEERREQLLDDFVGSPFGGVEGLTLDQVRGLADPLVGFACDYGPGDPLRWSPVSVEIVLCDWYPRKVFGFDQPVLSRLPDVLAAFVEFAQLRCGIRATSIAETVGSVELWRGHFIRGIPKPGRSPAANATRMERLAAGFDPEDFDDDDDDLDVDFDPNDLDDFDENDDVAYMREMCEVVETSLVGLLGSTHAYDNLDDVPLVDVPFDWSKVPESVHADTASTLAHLDRWAPELFDAEIATIARRVLAAVISEDPGVFKRSPRADALAAAILAFLLGRVFRPQGGRAGFSWAAFTQKALAEATGVSASMISGRKQTVSNVVERARLDWATMLHSSQRRAMLETKSHIKDWRQAHPI